MAAAPALAALDRILDPVGRCLTPEVARALLELHLDAQTQARLDELAERSTEGALLAEEREEYEACISAIDFLAVLQAKARFMLTATSPP